MLLNYNNFWKLIHGNINDENGAWFMFKEKITLEGTYIIKINLGL